MLQTEAIFAVGLVLRHSRPQVMLRKLVREDRAVGDVISVEHTEAVAWKHFEHCYVRYVPHKLDYKLSRQLLIISRGSCAENPLAHRRSSQSRATTSIFFSGFSIRRLLHPIPNRLISLQR